MAWNRTDPPRRVDQCDPGFYLAKFRKGAMLVACRIIRWEDGMWQAAVGGVLGKAVPDWATIPDIDRIRFGKIITEAEYEFWLTRAAFAKQHAPDHPAINPNVPVNWRRMRP